MEKTNIKKGAPPRYDAAFKEGAVKLVKNKAALPLMLPRS
jgi:hypothetical protein